MELKLASHGHMTVYVCKSILYPAIRLSTCLSAATYSMYCPLREYVMPYMHVQSYAVCQMCVSAVKYRSHKQLSASSIRHGTGITGGRGFGKGRRVCEELGECDQALERANDNRQR
jgi:hypothetical protein